MSLYHGAIIEHSSHPRNRADVPDATATAEASNPLCGDRVRISVRVDAGVIAAIGFAGDACAVCVASASLLTERARGARVDAMQAVDDASVLAALHTELPEARRRCATLPLDALQRALRIRPAARDVVAIVLAAGHGSRFGGDKVTALLAGSPVVRHVVDALEGLVGETIVIAGENEGAVRAALAGCAIRVIRNSSAEQGMSSSIATGVDACGDAAAAMIVLGDQPSMDRGVIASVIDGWRGGGGEIVAPSYRGVRAPPVIFSRSMFDELRIPRGDVGARALMDRHASRLMVIDVDCPPPADVDTSDDLARLEAERRRDR